VNNLLRTAVHNINKLSKKHQVKGASYYDGG